jgi:hypothetical protein
MPGNSITHNLTSAAADRRGEKAGQATALVAGGEHPLEAVAATSGAGTAGNSEPQRGGGLDYLGSWCLRCRGFVLDWHLQAHLNICTRESAPAGTGADGISLACSLTPRSRSRPHGIG